MSNTRNIFISHRWYSNEYDKIKEWLENAPYYKFSDYSITVEKRLEELSDKELEEKIAERIKRCSVFIVPTSMRIYHSKWMQFEIDTAVKAEKPIVAVTPNGQEREAIYVTRNATTKVGWRSDSVLNAVIELTKS